MSEKMKGITITSVYDEKKFISEVNDEPSETVTTGYIPIDEQVKMIIRGEVTIGNLDRGYEQADDDIETESPEEVFEDAVDIGSLYQDDIRNAYLAETSKGSASNQTEQQLDETDAIKAQQESERALAEQANAVSE